MSTSIRKSKNLSEAASCVRPLASVGSRCATHAHLSRPFPISSSSGRVYMSADSSVPLSSSILRRSGHENTNMYSSQAPSRPILVRAICNYTPMLPSRASLRPIFLRGICQNTHGEETTAVVIPSANSSMSQPIVASALAQGMYVVALTSDVKKAKEIYPNSSNLEIRGIEFSEYKCTEVVERIVKSGLAKRCFSRVGVINTLGGTTSTLGKPDSSLALRERNVTSSLGFIEGALYAVKDCTGSYSVVHISSIVVSLLDPKICEYTRLRFQAEQEISKLALGLGARNVTVLRLGLVQASPQVDPKTGITSVNSGHNHSAENWAGSRLIFVAGEDALPMQQPIFGTCVAEGVLNAIQREDMPEVAVIDGVGSQKMTQSEYLTYFTHDKHVLCLHVPLEVLHFTAQLVSNGRLQPYAVNILESLEKNPRVLDHAPFEQLLGRPVKGMDEEYGSMKMSKFQHPGKGMYKYIYAFCKSLLKDPCQVAQLADILVHSQGWKLSIIEK